MYRSDDVLVLRDDNIDVYMSFIGGHIYDIFGTLQFSCIDVM